MNNLPTGENTDAASQPAQNPPVPPLFIRDPGIDEQEHGGHRKAEGDSKAHKAPAWIEALCAIALVIITGFYTHYAAQQADAAITAAKAAKEAAQTNTDLWREDHRPWIVVQAVKTEPEKIVPDKDFFVRVQFVNDGKTPPYNAKVCIGRGMEKTLAQDECGRKGKPGNDRVIRIDSLASQSPAIYQERSSFQPLHLSRKPV